MPPEEVTEDACGFVLGAKIICFSPSSSSSCFFFLLVLFLQNMLVSFLLSAVILCESEASGEFAPTGAGARLPTTSLLHVDEEEEDGGNFSARRVVEPTAGSY